MLTGHKVIAKALAWLGGGGNGVFLNPPVLNGGPVILSLLLSPPGLHWHLDTCVLAGLEGGSKATSNCPGKMSSLLTSLLSRRRGEEDREGTPHARVLSICLSPPSSPTLLFSPRPKQAQAPRPGGRAVLTLRKVREPSRLEAGSPEAGPKASNRGQCLAWSPLTPHLRSLALDQKNWVSLSHQKEGLASST